jgi:hypothetical protein
MKKSDKAALLSALVFPGTGHFALKRYPRGILFFAPSMLALVVILDGVMRQVSAILDKVLSGVVSSDPATILLLASGAGSDSSRMTIATWVVVACWVISIVDSYLIGRSQDKADAKREPGS